MKGCNDAYTATSSVGAGWSPASRTTIRARAGSSHPCQYAACTELRGKPAILGGWRRTVPSTRARPSSVVSDRWPSWASASPARARAAAGWSWSAARRASARPGWSSGSADRRRTSVPVRWGRAVDEPGAPPLWPWRATARRAARRPRRAARGRRVAPGSGSWPTTTDALLRAAEPAGLVVVLEDLHWADETSLRLLRRIAGEVAGSRLVVVATYRDGGSAGLMADALPDLLRWSTTHPLPLPPLVEHDVRAYLGLALHRAADPEQVRALLHRSGGNPLYLRAVTDLVRAGASPAPADGDAGSQLRTLVRGRSRGCPRRVGELLAAAAVLGEQVDVGVAGRGLRAARAGGAARRWTTRCAPGCWPRCSPTCPAAPAGSGSCTPSCARASTPTSTRRSASRCTGAPRSALQEQSGHDPARAGLVAGHWLRCARDPAELRTAAGWALRAADAATRAFADAEAARYLAMALGELERAGPATVNGPSCSYGWRTRTSGTAGCARPASAPAGRRPGARRRPAGPAGTRGPGRARRRRPGRAAAGPGTLRPGARAGGRRAGPAGRGDPLAAAVAADLGGGRRRSPAGRRQWSREALALAERSGDDMRWWRRPAPGTRSWTPRSPRTTGCASGSSPSRRAPAAGSR